MVTPYSRRFVSHWQESLVAKMAPVEARRAAVLRELDRARVAFRGISRATDSRAIRACLVPPGVLFNSAPYLAFTIGGQGRTGRLPRDTE